MAQSLEERKARDAERKRNARAAARAARDAEKKTSADAADAPLPTEMFDSVVESLAAMKWLQPSDGAAVKQARKLAASIDRLEHAGEESKALSAHRALTAVLNDLGGTPTVRMQHELRSLKLAKKTGDGDDGSDDTGHTAKVTQLKRPPKREKRA